MAYKNFAPEYWSKKLAINFDNNGVMMQVVNRDYEADLKGGGDSVNINTLGDVTVNTYGGVVAYETPEEVNTQLLLDQQEYFGFKVDDISKVQANIKLVDRYMERAKIAVNLKKDTFLLSKHSDVVAGNTIGTTGSPIPLTENNVYGYCCDLAEILRDNNAFDGYKPWLVVNPKFHTLLLKAPEFIAINNPMIAQETILKGAVGQIAGLNIMVTSNLVEVSSKYYFMAGIKEAITYASQIDEMEALRDTQSFNDLVRGLYVYGAKTVNPSGLAKIIATIA